VRTLRRPRCGPARKALALSVITCAALAITVMTPRVSVCAGEQCSEEQKVMATSKVNDHKKALLEAQRNLHRQEVVNANQFLSTGTISAQNDASLRYFQRDLTQWEVIIDHDRAEFTKCFGYEPFSLLGEGVRPKKSGTQESPPAPPAAGAEIPAAPNLTGAVKYSMGFESGSNAYALVSAPDNWAWLKVFGDMNTGLHVIAMMICPTASGGNGKYQFECTYTLFYYDGKDPNAGPPAQVKKGKGQVDLTIAPRRQSKMTLHFFGLTLRTFHEAGTH
jgi:hypothetical protein